MATKQKSSQKSTTKRKSSGSNSGRRGRPPKNKGKAGNLSAGQSMDPEKKALFYDEILLVASLVIALLLILSNFNLSGKVGGFINGVTFGLFGFLAYLLPFFLFFGMAFYIANRGNYVARIKLMGAIALSIAVSSLIHLITYGYTQNSKIGDIYKMSSESKNGGGIIGGILCNVLYPLFGKAGTYIILIALTIISIMFITGKALLTILGVKSEASLKQMKERRLQREEEMAAEEERRPAKTFTLKKEEDSKKMAATGDDSQDKNAGNKGAAEKGDGLFGFKKKKKAAAHDNVSSPNIDSFDMEEIKPMDVDDIPIQRSNSYYDETSVNEKVSEELKAKFGTGGDSTLSNPEVQNRPGIDDDIKRLLHAAGEDVVDSDAGAYNTEKEQSQSTQMNSFPEEEKQGAVHEVTNKVSSRSSSAKSSVAGDGEVEPMNINQNLEEKKEYIFPTVDLLTRPKANAKGMTDKDLKETALKLQKTLESFGVQVTITNVSCGPAVTRYELQPEQGVKVSKITSLADDIKLNLAAADIRIEAPIPGKAAVGIEVPNKENTMVMFRELIEANEFKKHPSDIAFAVGKDIGGQPIVTDIAKMPHLLIAGATGSGKSVCINTLIMSILYKSKPSDVRLIMVDPKVVELSVYNGIPHLLIPVVTDPKKASAALNWAVMEMTERYQKFAELGVRDIKGYNEKVSKVEEFNDEKYQKMPQIVIIVDELADLMMVAPGEVEDAICRLAQMARAAGLHLIIATQRPSVNVITGLIKANVPSRIAFSVSSAIDSRTIIDGSGAEKLLGKGDMLFFPSGYPKPIRVQGAFVSDKEVSAVVDFLTAQNSSAEYNEEVAQKITSVQANEASGSSPANDRDEYFMEAGKFIIEKDKASIGMLQRVYKIGFNRAARIMDQLAEAGVVGPEEGTKPRKVLMSLEEFEQFIDEYV
ncbi:FtsK/SpoIIIE family DNA translocase [Anaerocolumna sp.]|uniref:FtsK/SpoIIIE family DNA translocase n=1 Tax=Anaerocolumna sp. TaxID=2041569 RepID=UPI0028ACF4D2|nr:DNA translocase FtsK [Anaerocolumna sp.]